MMRALMWMSLLVLVLLLVHAGRGQKSLCSRVEALRSRVAALSVEPSLVPQEEEPVHYEVSYDARAKTPWLEAVRAFSLLKQEVSSYGPLLQRHQESEAGRHAAELRLAGDRLLEVSQELQLQRSLAQTLRDHVAKMAALKARRAEYAGRLAAVTRRLLGR